jgi:hypothetical protein
MTVRQLRIVIFIVWLGIFWAAFESIANAGTTKAKRVRIDDDENLYDSTNVEDALEEIRFYSGGLFELDANSNMMPVDGLSIDTSFEEDGNNDLQPLASFTILDKNYELDGNGDIMPKE